MKAAEKTGSKLQKLTELFTGKAYLLVVMQDTPDPDSLAAAVALRRLAKSLANLQCSLAYGGTVGRGENRALVKYLGLNLRPCDEIDYEKYDLVAMVDTQPGTGNNSLPETVTPNIVIDHHPIRRQTRTAAFTDVRSGYGAASTILVEYLIEAGITPDTPLATALLYGIRSDTQDLGREASRSISKPSSSSIPSPTSGCSASSSEERCRGCIIRCWPMPCAMPSSGVPPLSPRWGESIIRT